MKNLSLLFVLFLWITFTHLSQILSNSCTTCSSCNVENKLSNIKTCNPSCLESQVPIFYQCGLRDYSSKTFLFPRPVYDNLAAKQALWHSIIYDKTGNIMGAWQLTTLFQDSMESEKIKRYFLINQKSSLTVKGDDFKEDRDIRAKWLSIDNPKFNAEFSINPRNRQFGVVASYQQDLKKVIDWKFFESWWAQLDLPLVITEHEMRLTESFSECTTGTNICKAFDQCDWKFGKISGKQRKITVPELIVSLGTNMLNRRHSQIGLYSSLLIPTGQKYDPTYLFNTVAGHNGHFGFCTGAQFQFRINRYHPEQYVAFFFNIENQFLLRNSQLRTFDLKGKPFSRYLLFNSSDGDINIPGVNILTLDTKVSPFNIVDLSTGIRVKGERFEGELGYNLWAHGSEELLLKKPFPEIYGIAGTGKTQISCPDFVKEVGATASTSTIAQQCANDQTFTPIKALDIDLFSAASSTVITHKFHISLGCIFKDNAFAGVGAFIEGPQNNAMFKQWGVWAKVGSTL